MKQYVGMSELNLDTVENMALYLRFGDLNSTSSYIRGNVYDMLLGELFIGSEGDVYESKSVLEEELLKSLNERDYLEMLEGIVIKEIDYLAEIVIERPPVATPDMYFVNHWVRRLAYLRQRYTKGYYSTSTKEESLWVAEKLVDSIDLKVLPEDKHTVDYVKISLKDTISNWRSVLGVTRKRGCRVGFLI